MVVVHYEMPKTTLANKHAIKRKQSTLLELFFNVSCMMRKWKAVIDVPKFTHMLESTTMSLVIGALCLCHRGHIMRYNKYKDSQHLKHVVVA